MTYLETFLFVAKCLTISSDMKNRSEIEFILKKSMVDWDSVVKLSTNHLVLTSLFLNFKSTGFLNFVPVDLVNYMKFLEKINYNRNN